MALIQGSKVDVISGINRDVQVLLDPNGVLLGIPHPVEEDPSGTTVQARLTCIPEYQYRGSQVITYQRLGFAELVTLFPALPNISPRETLYELLEGLRTATGVGLSEDDVEDAPVEAQGDGTYHVLLKAKPLSQGWYGEGTLVFQDLPPLSLVITDVTLEWN